jgi:hypothetical protein
MREMVLTHIQPSKVEETAFLQLCGTHKRWLAAFFVSAISGASFGVFGLIISVLILSGSLNRGTPIDEIGYGSLIAAFPLLLCAAHCLDKAGDAKKALRGELCKDLNKKEKHY